MKEPSQHPTEREIAGFCEVIDLMVSWIQDAEILHTDEAAALQATRTFVAFASRDTAEAQERACAQIYPADLGLTPELVELRRAILIVAGAAVYRANAAAVSDEIFGGWERLLLTHATHVGTLLHVNDPARLARVALHKAKNAGHKPSRFPEPEFARQLAVGVVLAQYRRLRKLSQKALCDLVVARGTRLTVARLARLEAGQTWKDAPWMRIAECVGVTHHELQRRGAAAHAFAQEIARRLPVTNLERWFAETVAVDGEDAARACLLVGAVAAVRLPAEKLPPI